MQTAADDLVSQLNQSAGGNSGLTVVDTPTGANLTGLLTVPVPIENTVLVEAGNKSTLFAALNQDGASALEHQWSHHKKPDFGLHLTVIQIHRRAS